MKLRNITAILICVAAFAYGQEPHGSEPRMEAPTRAAALSDEDYRIGPRDVIDIQIDRAPQLSGTYQVSSDGTFLMPFLERVHAQGRTPEELTAFIADRLRGRYLKNPIVRVVVRQINSRSFFIQGAVRNPGAYQISGRATLLKLITMAGGLAENHGSTAYIIRESAKSRQPAAELQSAGAAFTAEDDYDLTTASITGLLKGRFDQNTVIEPGDIVNIPTADLFFVAGEVNAPGSFPLKEGTTLRQAISLAQGTTFKAVTSRATIFREDAATGKRQEIRVDIGAVMSGKKEDVAIAANDIIIVPNSQLKSFAGALLRAFGYTASRAIVPRL